MSDTEDTEEFIVNVSKKKHLKEGNDNQYNRNNIRFIH